MWADGAELDQSESSWQPHGKAKKPLTDLGWDAALAAYRPFLPYSELGDLLTDKPAALHDALSKVLGLEDLIGVQKLLAGVAAGARACGQSSRGATRPAADAPAGDSWTHPATAALKRC